MCNFIRPDGVTLVLTGTVSENEAYIDLPAAAYSVPGSFTLSIKISGSGFNSTVRVVDGTIIDTTTGEIVDNSVIIDISEWETMIEESAAAVEDIAAISVSSAQITGTRYKIIVTKE